MIFPTAVRRGVIESDRSAAPQQQSSPMPFCRDQRPTVPLGNRIQAQRAFFGVGATSSIAYIAYH